MTGELLDLTKLKSERNNQKHGRTRLVGDIDIQYIHIYNAYSQQGKLGNHCMYMHIIYAYIAYMYMSIMHVYVDHMYMLIIYVTYAHMYMLIIYMTSAHMCMLIIYVTSAHMYMLIIYVLSDMLSCLTSNAERHTDISILGIVGNNDASNMCWLISGMMSARYCWDAWDIEGT